MMKVLTALAALSTVTLSYSEVIMSSLFDDHMVLQRDREVSVWGWADEGEEVTVRFAGQEKSALPDESGKWMVRRDPMAASAESRTMMISGSNVIELEDVLVGEVWLAMGQSNMEWGIGGVVKEERDIAFAQRDNPLIRSYRVSEHLQSAYPMNDTIGSWRLAEEMVHTSSQKTSAVAFFFVATLQEALGVPVAFIDVSWGGRQIEPFIPTAGYEAVGLPYRNNLPYDEEGIRERLLEQQEAILDAMESLDKGIVKPLPEFSLHGWSTNGIYNAMIAPLEPYAVKGTIWYQGESNRGRSQYFEQVKALAIGLAEVFENENMPLYQVQIAPHAYRGVMDPSVSLLGDTIWSAQYQAARELPNVGIIPIHDTDIDIRNIHPARKQRVGERLAALALKEQYGKNLPATGPRFSSARMQEGKVVVQFDEMDEGLTTKDGEVPSWFELSVDGEVFVSAEAELSGDTVVVWSEQVKEPRYVRMGWADIAIPNLSDRNGWPVFAFPAQKVGDEE